MQSLLNIIYPRQCIGCGAEEPKPFHFICWDCWTDSRPLEPPLCLHCGDPVAGAIEHGFICYACAERKPAFEAARSAVRYNGIAGEALKLYKYERCTWLASDLGAILYHCLLAEYSLLTFDLVVPVPLHPTRRRQRGFNQSAMLARELVRRVRPLPWADLLNRTRPTATQTYLTASQRMSNVAQAFQPDRAGRRRLQKKRVLLVDDVMTTGATVNACAKALKRGGAASVHVLTVARG